MDTPPCDSSPWSDNRKLFPALRDGDEEAFSYVFTRYYRDLCSYAYRILYDMEEARESVQTVFFRLWDNHDRLDIRTSLKAYLYRAVYNGCLGSIRQRRSLARFGETDILEHYLSRVVQSPEAEMELFDSETKKAVMEAIDSLPSKCREIFIKCKFEGLTYIQAAQLKGISVKTVENQINIAHKKLRDSLRWVLALFIIS